MDTQVLQHTPRQDQWYYVDHRRNKWYTIEQAVRYLQPEGKLEANPENQRKINLNFIKAKYWQWLSNSTHPNESLSADFSSFAVRHPELNEHHDIMKCWQMFVEQVDTQPTQATTLSPFKPSFFPNCSFPQTYT